MSQDKARERAEPKASRPHMPKGYGVPSAKKGMLPWSHAEERLEKAKNYWISTTRPDGRPHAVPLWGAWVDGAFYFEGGPDTRRGRNLAANPAVVVHTESGDDVVIVEGVAEEVPNPDRSFAVRLADAFAAKYAGYRPDPDSWQGGGLYMVRPRLALAWSEFPKNATRWQFDE